MTNLDQLLTEIKDRADKASYGPWDVCAHHKVIHARGSCKGQVYVCGPSVGSFESSRDDFNFIAHSRSDIPLLCEIIERMREGIDHITTCIEREDNHETAYVSNYYRLKDARQEAERTNKAIDKLIAEAKASENAERKK